MRIEQLCREFDLTLRWTVFPLHPETPLKGRELADLFAGRVNVPKVMADLKKMAEGLGLPFVQRTHTYNSRHAQELGKWAEQLGQGGAFRDAIYRAYFGEGRNIAKVSELIAICESLDLSSVDAVQVLDEGRFSAEVDADWDRARTVGISSVPSHVYENRVLVGFQEYPAFQQLIKGSLL